MPKISDLPTDTAPASTDLIPFVDVDAARTESVTVANLAASAAFAGQYAPLGVALSPFHALRQSLTDGVDPVAVTVLGDSTGNNTNEWIDEAVVALATDYPAYTLRRWLWSDAIQSYERTTAQVGTAGDAYVTLDGTGDMVSTPDAAVLDVAGDIDIRVKIAANDWTPAALSNIVAKYDGAGQRAWRLYLNTSGLLTLQWTEDGSTAKNQTSSVATGATDGAAIWIKATLDVDNGAAGHDVKFYTSTDSSGEPASWVQLGTTKTGAGVTSIASGSSVFTLGARGASALEPLACKIYSAEYRNGIDGTVVGAFDASMWAAGATMPGPIGGTWTLAADAAVAGAPALTFYNGSHPGGTLSYSNDVTRFALLTPTAPQVCYVNYGHNDATTGTMADDLETLIDAVRAKYPQCSVVLSQQNPETSPRTTAQIAAQRRAQKVIVPGVAAAKGCPMVAGVYDAIAADLATYMNADGVHPVSAGSDVWAAIALAQLRTG